MDEASAAWSELVRAARVWATEYLDHRDGFSVMTDHGRVYVTLTREVSDPGSFDSLDEETP